MTVTSAEHAVRETLDALIAGAHAAGPEYEVLYLRMLKETLNGYAQAMLHFTDWAEANRR